MKIDPTALLHDSMAGARSAETPRPVPAQGARERSPVSPVRPAPASAGARRAAEQFEAIFLRKILASLEKSSKVGSGASSGSAEAYSSMVVGALADAVAASGGLASASPCSARSSPGGRQFRPMAVQPRGREKPQELKDPPP